jgi:L-lactate dehydrogenase complex protein LldF
MRHLRTRQMEQRLRPWTERAALGVWSWMARRPAVYAAGARIIARLLQLLAGDKKRLRYLIGVSGWTKGRDLPAPAGRTFRDLYKSGKSS